MQAPSKPSALGVPAPASNNAESMLVGFDASGLPHNFVQRLLRDSEGAADYRRIRGVETIERRAANSGFWGVACASCCCRRGTLVMDGEMGVLSDGGTFAFLAPGYHTASRFGTHYSSNVKITTVDKAVAFGSVGFVTVSEAKVGVLMVGASYKLLAPGTYQWTSAQVQLIAVTSLLNQVVQLGPYTLITVPVGQVAVTFNNGELVVLGEESNHARDNDMRETFSLDAPKRTYFLENAKWSLEGFLPMVMQTDRLEGNDLLSKDNVEVLMVAMAQWRIVNPVKAVTNCASDMEAIRVKVNQLVRATIARIVASTNIGAGPVSGASNRPVVTAIATAAPVAGAPVGGVSVPDAPSPAAAQPAGEADLSHLMKSEVAAKHMAELTIQMEIMGIEVCGVYVPEKRMKNDDIRREVAKQAVIGIKAEAERAAADAKAYATVKSAHASAEAINLVAAAHAEAGRRLGNPESTAARLALSETVSRAMQSANLTLFSGAPDTMPFMFSAPSTAATRTAPPALQ